ncbi:rhodanese-like domain-containing protein 8, chloroplastic isoform X2 [Cornus florida]|uniref:rhodanese-like domain-containing protein 8, chloroplastic isoform X2 n=1 Tax=Cornus florida TaxID=4283 RepID=UPI00289E28E4|nr:rhodanese-like domain-containing protein 8, chloroplastic isoform X2 [Cornus florida]
MRGCAIVTGFTLAPLYKPTTTSSLFQFPTWSFSTPIFILPKRTNRNRSLSQLKRRNFYGNACDESFGCGCVPSSSPQAEDGFDVDDNCFIVVNFYHFVFIKDPEDEVSKHLSFLQGLDIHGRIYLNEQGINAQYSGPSKDSLAYVKWLREDHRFSDVLVQISPALDGHAFPKLKLRYKPSLVQLEGGISHLPLLDPSMRATPLTPSQWRNKLETLNIIDETSKANLNTKYVLLDVRNGYEWDIGHFHGAQRPDVDCFRSTSFGLSQSEVITPDPLHSVDKERTTILMYCTGGIRCDVYSSILRISRRRRQLVEGLRRMVLTTSSQLLRRQLYVPPPLQLTSGISALDIPLQTVFEP